MTVGGLSSATGRCRRDAVQWRDNEIVPRTVKPMKKFLIAGAFVLPLVLIGIMVVVGYEIYTFTRPVELTALSTPWTEKVNPEAPLQEYPRPQLRRDDWQNLNGRWQYSITSKDGPRPENFSDEIIVPYPIESSLSGAAETLLPGQRLWYKKTFTAQVMDAEKRLLLHFGAVDWESEIWLNGRRLGSHRGGYVPFSFDATDALRPSGPQELVVAVWDPTNTGPGAYGKQHLVPHGIRYTPVSGIWQTVWTEVVPESRVESMISVTNLAGRDVTLKLKTRGATSSDNLDITVYSGNEVVAQGLAAIHENQAELRIAPEMLRLWSPDDPFLYDVKIQLVRDGVPLDSVASYFGAREVMTAKDSQGITRLFLNGQPIFHLGLLDQGWWPDGLYTAPTDEALRYDIEATRRMGFNTIRKHVKVEPARWYWHADRIGVLVWQDMPTGDGGDERYGQVFRQAIDIFSAQLTGKPLRKLDRSAESATLYKEELRAIIDYLEFFPSIVAWVPFNEAWGQFDTDEVLNEVKERDPHRITGGPSGWFDTGTGDVIDLHMYLREADFVEELPSDRAVIYGEFGGLALPVEEHTSAVDGWGYSNFDDNGDFEGAYLTVLSIIEGLIPRGLAGAIYTQTTDVESEINGLMTYNRMEFKIAPEKLAEINQRLTDPDESPGLPRK